MWNVLFFVLKKGRKYKLVDLTFWHLFECADRNIKLILSKKKGLVLGEQVTWHDICWLAFPLDGVELDRDGFGVMQH